ncbi:MAG: 8-oxoguanine DNA glycosylase [Lachnospiraceae bacterium]|nr:8-oxoguanine DNA glycosylase [Lachnospiraceae bacterium]
MRETAYDGCGVLRIICSELDLGQICDSGQCFRMSRIPGTDDMYEIIATNLRVTARQHADGMELDCDEDEYERFWRSYFDIECGTDYAAIIGSIDPADEYLMRVAREGRGIRILRQDLWEMIVTFLISQQNNIPRIHKCIDNICREYGRYMEADVGAGPADAGSRGYYAFPAPEALAGLDEDDLMPCNLGYRSKYVVRAARAVTEGTLDLDALLGMDHADARARLLEVYGIGNKVADCICLFALHHIESFPIDTHIRQVLEREYGSGYGDAFPFSRYQDHLGVIQQYMFYGELNISRR